MRQKHTKNDTYISNKISTSRKYTNILLQHHNNKKNDINFNIDTPTNTCNHIPTVYRERNCHRKTTIMESNGSYVTNKNEIISDSRNNNNKKEYRITNPRPIKDTNNEGTRVTNKNINCNKEPIPTSNAYLDESNKNKNIEHNTITVRKDTKISQSYQTNIRHSKQNTTPMYNNNRTQTGINASSDYHNL